MQGQHSTEDGSIPYHRNLVHRYTVIILRPPKNFVTYYIPVTCYLKCNICHTAQQLKVPSISYIVNRIVLFNPLTPVKDQDRISLYHINTILSRRIAPHSPPIKFTPSSLPLPYAVFAPTLFEFYPIKSSSPLD